MDTFKPKSMFLKSAAISVAGLLVTVVIAGAAPAPRRSVITGSADVVFPHIADGGQWTTSFTLMNLSTKPSPYTLSFFGDDGSPLTLVILGIGAASGVTGTLEVNGSVVLQTAGGGSIRQGWAQLDYTEQMAGFAVFKSHRPGFEDSEAAVPLGSYYEHRFVMAFDNTAGYVTGVAIVNPSQTVTATVFVTFRDESGNQIQLDSFTMGPLTHTAFSVPEFYPQVADRRGVVEFSTSSAALAGLGLRFNPAGSFTSTSPFSDASW